MDKPPNLKERLHSFLQPKSITKLKIFFVLHLLLLIPLLVVFFSLPTAAYFFIALAFTIQILIKSSLATLTRMGKLL